MTDPEKTIFISHSTQDKAAVSAVRDALDQAGLKYWISTRDIPDGATWSKSIISGLNNSQALVLIYSTKSNQSPHVKRELERAVSKRIPIIPFRIENVPMSLDMEYYISTRQWTEAANPPSAAQLKDLVRAIKRNLNQDSGLTPLGKVPGKYWKLSLFLRLAIVLLIIGLGYYAIQRYLGENPTEPPTETPMAFSERESVGIAGQDSLKSTQGGGEKPVEPEIRPQNRPLDFGLVTFTSQPTGARVILDGTIIGETPLHDYRVAGGSWDVHFLKIGYDRATRSFNIANGGNRAVDATLPRLPGSLSVSTIPDGASLLLDGRILGTAPWTFSGLQKGWHRVDVSMPGFVTRTDSAEVWYGQEAQIEVTLVELRGELAVEVIPSGRILVDGSLKPNKNNEPLSLDLKPGSYRIEARSPLYGSWFKTVEILGQDRKNLIFDFTTEYQCKVLSDPSNAAIFVNGRATGKFTPAMLRLRPGQRSIQVDKDGYLSTGPQEFCVESDLVEPVKFILRKSP